ncbi:MAG: hypothetical protein COB78_10790 [Hyphomicrobiales bacterium]|nr:MAG: hypothetical protein COB78_10790 [Hyphomicrobiales bacterium]
MADYSDRKLENVTVGKLTPITYRDKTSTLVRVSIGVTDVDGNDMGPSIQLDFSMPSSMDMTAQEIKDMAVSRSHALIQRIAKESEETLLVASKKPSELNFGYE